MPQGVARVRQNGKPHKDSTVRRLKPDHSNIHPPSEEGKIAVKTYSNGWLEKYRDNWRVLGLPEAETF